MFGKSLKDLMPPIKYTEMRQKQKNTVANWSDEKRTEIGKKHSITIKGRKQMYNPNTDDKPIRVFPVDFQKYLNLGYKFSDKNFVYDSKKI